jgi:tRNA1Val (adenine37-N6)-methyltransferase
MLVAQSSQLAAYKMANSFFQFKQFTIQQDKSAMKVTTDACLFGALVAGETQPGNTLDIGAGTGLLSLMLAQKNPGLSVEAIEIDEAAAAQAIENVESSSWKSRVSIIHADARNYPYNKKYDLIVSNPPFYENELRSDDDKKNTAHHDESLLLKDVLRIIKTNLNANGSFYLLLPYKRMESTRKMLWEDGLAIEKLTLVRQSTRHDYFRLIIKGTLSSDKLIETELDELSIWDDQQNYTEKFISLLKDYYLYL